MALVNSVGCCELFTAGVCIGVYTMIVYLGAFIMELWWIIENNVQLPVPAYVLAAGYFSIFLVSLFLLAGLFLRKSNYLLGWLFVSVLFFFPECGLALFMSLQYWKLDSKGIAELAFYIARAVMNVVSIVCVQSLYTQWKQEKAVMRRLQNLNVTSYRDLAPSKSNGSAGPSSSSNGVGSASPGAHRANGSAGGSLSSASRPRFVTAADTEPTYIMAHNSALKRSTSSVSGLMVRAVGGGPQPGGGVYNAAFNGSLNGCVLGPSGVDFYAPNPALWPGPSPRSEFDASSFADLVARGGPVGGGGLLNGYRSMSRSTSELNRGEPWTTAHSAVAASPSPLPSAGPVDYATQSLDRPKFRRQGGGRNRWDVLDVRGFGDVTLERLPERPFQYLNRPGSVVRGNDSDTSSSHSIRDIAL